MSFLTPLYLLGALAVVLPVLFHMIRRTPRGRREFSSVMFLEPSPPRITRRSRIEHWLLLVLRALAVCVLAIAFARPFWRVTQEQALVDGESRDFVLLVDTSASMRREGVWPDAVSRVEELLDQMQPWDRVSLVVFDIEPRVLVDFAQWTSLDPIQRVEAAKTALAATSPTWGATDLGRALTDAAERLDADVTEDEVPRSQTIVVVSDLQEGSRLEALQAYQWPPQVWVRLETVGVGASPNNAGLQPFVQADAATGAEGRIRVRITNAADARHEQFTLRGVDEFGAAPVAEFPSDDSPHEPRGTNAATAVTVIVPPGQSRIVSAPGGSSGANVTQLVLEGDDHDFDNVCYVPAPAQRSVTVAVLSERGEDDPQGLWYYAARALASAPRRAVEVRPLGDVFRAESESLSPDLIVIAATPSVEQTARLRAFLGGGGTVLFVPLAAADVPLLHELAGVAPAEAAEASVQNYAMLTDIDWSHPLFAALDHPRFSDFTKVRFWKHRTVDPASLPDVRIAARFDDGEVAAGEVRLGTGRLVFLTSGWHPDDSQLALSTKFVPMLNGLLDRAAGFVETPNQFVVGESVELAAFSVPGDRVGAVRIPNGDRVPIDDGARMFESTGHPGRYRVHYTNGNEHAPAEFVINLDPNESRTAPLPRQTLEVAHVQLDGSADAEAVSVEGARQLRGSELEQRQKLWRWLIVAAMLLLLAETWLAGRTSRAPAGSPPPG